MSQVQVERTAALRRFAAWCGVAAPLVALSAIILSAIYSPEFSWVENALSDLGGPGAATPEIFNWGLILASLLAIIFMGRVWVSTIDLIEKTGVFVFILAAVSLGLIGLFPTGTEYHFPASVGFFLLFTYALFIFGTGNIFTGLDIYGLMSIWLGIMHMSFWALWVAGLRDQLPGLAVPEFVGALIVSTWMILTAHRLLRE